MKQLFKRILPCILIFTLAAACSLTGVNPNGGSDKDSDEPITINVYEGGSVKLRHTVDNSGNVLKTNIYEDYGTVTKTYDYDYSGNLSAITRTNPQGEVFNTFITTDSALTRSGKPNTVIKRFSTTSGSRSGSIEQIFSYSYAYSNNDNLTEITKNYGHNNKEVKNTVEDAAAINQILMNGTRSAPSVPGSYTKGDLPDWAANYDITTIKPYFENMVLKIRGDVVDLRENGIRENIVNGQAVTRSLLDLQPGMVFIDSDEISRRVSKIEKNGNTYTILTSNPYMTEIFYGGSIPRQTVWITDPANIVDGIAPPGTTVTRSGDTRAISTSFEKLIWKSGVQSVTVNFAAELGVAISVDVDLGSPGWFCWNDGYAYAYVHPNIDLSGGFTFKIEGDSGDYLKVPLFGFNVGVASLGVFAQPKFEGSLSAYVKSGVKLGGYLGGKCVLDPWPEDVQMVNNLEYGFYGEAGLNGNIAFKPKLYIGGDVSLLGYDVVEIDPGGGFYAELSGSISGGFEWTNTEGASLYWKSEGKAEAGIFLDASLEVAETWKWTLFEWKYPLYEYDAWSTESEKEWQHIECGALTYIDATSDGTVVAVHNNAPFMLESDRETFSPMGSNYPSTKLVTAGAANSIWLLSTSGKPYQWNGSSWIARPGVLSHLDAPVSGNNVAAVGNTFYVWNGSNWVEFNGIGLTQIARSTNDYFCVTAAGNVHRWIGGNWGREIYNRDFTSISAGANDTLYGVNKWGDIFNITGGMKRIYGLTAKQVAYGSDDHLYAIDNDGKFYHYTE